MHGEKMQEAREKVAKEFENLFLPESLKPVKSIPDLLSENRQAAVDLAGKVMGAMKAIATFFGVPLMDLVMETIPEDADSLWADGIRETAAAKTYFVMQGSVSLDSLCKSMYACRGPALKAAALEYQKRGGIQEAAEDFINDDVNDTSPAQDDGENAEKEGAFE